MVIRIKREDGGIDRIVTQQYELGLYVAIYDDKSGRFKDQFGTSDTEEKYYKYLKEKYKDKLIEQN